MNKTTGNVEYPIIVGIDNSRGDAWTEEFKSWDAFKLWITTQMTVEEAEARAKIGRRKADERRSI